MKKIHTELESRGSIHQMTDPKLAELLDSESLTVYCGFDPTSDSLHIGNLFGLINLRRLQMAGHRPILLVGGATGMIGDPSGKSQERQLQGTEQIDLNVKGISKVLSQFLSFDGPNAAILVNNFSWYKDLTILDFLRDVGKHFTVNYMIAKDSVRARLEDREQGISFTEFSYMLLQSYDFFILNEKEGCSVQLGGADQWGNITAGTELIRRINAASEKPAPHVYGLTWPLVTKADGSKFGKTETGNIWLSADKTSPYRFYQFLIRIGDEDVVRFLKYFTFLSLEEIGALELSLQSQPEKRLAQEALARELTILVHGEAEYQKVKKASAALFSADVKDLDAETLLDVLGDAPTTRIPLGEFESGMSLVEILVKTGLSSSKGEARKDIQGGGIYVNNDRVTELMPRVEFSHLIQKAYLVLRRGKKTYHLVVIS